MDSSCRWDFIYPANVILSISFQRACILEICFHFCSIPYFNLLLGDKILVLQNLDEFTTRLIKSYHRQLSSAQRYIYELWVKYVLKAVLKKRQTHKKNNTENWFCMRFAAGFLTFIWRQERVLKSWIDADDCKRSHRCTASIKHRGLMETDRTWLSGMLGRQLPDHSNR